MVYGDSFLQYKKTASGEILLERIEIADMEVIVHTKNFDYLFDFKDENGKIMESDNIIHFQADSIMPPFGESVYGYWFHTWNNIREHFKMLNFHAYQERNIEDYDALNRLRQMFERETILGSGLFIAIFNRHLANNPATPFNIAFLDSEARSKQESIQDTVEREIFPLVLNRECEWESNFPNFIIKGKLNTNNKDRTNTNEL